MTERFPDWIASRAASIPHRTALVVDGNAWTFAEIDAEVSRTARRLAALAVTRGDRVATLLHNGVTASIIPHATLRLGASLVPLNVRLTAREIAFQISDTQPRVVVADNSTLDLLEHAIQNNPEMRVVVADGATTSASGTALSSVEERDIQLILEHEPDTVLAIIYTSGTTGQPKGAMLTVSNFWWSAIGSALNAGVDPTDRWLACLPLFHVGGLSILVRSAIYGTAAIIHDSFDAEKVNAAIDAGGVTMISVVGVMLQRMLDARGSTPYPASLRCVLLGGGPVAESLVERCSALQMPVMPTYGLTETSSQVVTLEPGDRRRKPGAAGKALYPNEVRIITDFHDDAQSGHVGEILVRGPVVMKGYVDEPEATERAIIDGWLHTGDIGRIDEEGYLYVLDRRDDLIITGGENVYPAEVEAVLLSHPSVAEVGVVGRDDAMWGQRVVAVMRLHEGASDRGATIEQLRKHCESRLAGYKTPREFQLVTEPLPRTASGKIRRSAVRELLENVVPLVH